jgi:alpha-L-arabinofuranosidase
MLHRARCRARWLPVVAALLWLLPAPAQARPSRPAAQLTVAAGHAGPAINSTQFGAFLEEINHSGDGGLYGELIRNRDLKEDPNAPVYWSPFTQSHSTATIALDSTQPLDSANPVSLKLSVGQITPGGSAGVANWGYWGVPVRPSTTYQVSFFARGSRTQSGPLTVSLVGLFRGTVWAKTTISGITDHWARYTTTIRTSSHTPVSIHNRFVITTSDPADSGSTMWFTIVSVFPPTYHGLPNGFRVDLMQKLAALHPGYFRIPGGNYLEGETVTTRFAWQNTIGPIEDRPGHDNSAWGYWSDDGIGLLEWLELAEQLNAQPLLAVYDGDSLDGTVVPPNQLQPYIQDALDEIQYAIGSTSTYWGARRAADGHPAPFDLKMVEVGNEDNLEPSGSYNAYRYPMFYDAIKAAYPQLKIVATAPVRSRPMDILDEHFYDDNPAYFISHAHAFDKMSRQGPKILVGEYAATQHSPTGTLAAALGEAAFLTGLVRNADLVIGASYAPLLVNVNDVNWPTNLIAYNELQSYGSPSYWVLKLLSDGHGRQVIGSRLSGASAKLFQVVSHSPGHTYVVVVNDRRTPALVNVKLKGLGKGARGGTATVLSGDPAAANSIDYPRTVAPKVQRLPRLGKAFAYRFAAESVTVLDLRS